MGKNSFKQCNWKGLNLKYTNNSYNSTAKKPTTQLNNGQKTWIDISPKKIYRWPISTWKNARYHWLLQTCKSKLLWGNTSHQSEWPSLISPQITNAAEGVEKREPSYTAGGNVNWYNHYGKQYGGTSKTIHRTTIWPSNPTPGHLSQQNFHSKRYMHPYVQSSTLFNSQDMETT